MKTYSAKPVDITKEWYVIDAADKTLGRMASNVAHILQGKHKPIYTPSIDTGDNVIVINAEKIILTGKKNEKKIYYRHSGYIGGLKEETFDQIMKRKPQMVIEHAVKGMLPKGRLGRQMFKKLKVYAGSKHPHEGQAPKVLEI